MTSPVRWAAGALCAVLCVAQAGAQQRPGDFRILGPGGGGAMFHPTISPLDPDTVLLSCDMSGDYITHDGGRAWRMFNLRGSSPAFVFDPVDPKVIYATGIGIWKSVDTGDTWNLLLPQPAQVKGISNPSDEADVALLVPSESGGVVNALPPTALAIDPLNPKWLSTVIGTRLQHSEDGGLHWSQNDELPSNVTHLLLTHKSGDHGVPKVVMAGNGGFWVSSGTHPLPLPLPAGVSRLQDEVLDAVCGKVLLLAVADGTLFQAWVDVAERNPRLTWRALTLPGVDAKVRASASGHDGKTLYASFAGMKVDGQVLQGIVKSEDLGEHWTFSWKDAGTGAANVADGWIGSTLTSQWAEEPFGLTVSEKNHALMYVTDLGRAMKSIDGGAHWTAVYSHTGKDGGAVSSGLDVLTSYGVHFDPFDPQRMFISYTDIGLMRSENRGETWWRSSDGAPFAWRNTTYWMVFDPAVKGRIWAAMSYTHDLPRPRMWIWAHGTSTFRGGIVTSTDGGKHWTQSSNGMPEAATTHVLLDPKSPPNARTLYAAAIGHGVFKSVDGGKTWTKKNQGITQMNPLVWRLTQATDGTLYVVITRESDLAKPGDPRDGALYRSRDGAETWEPVVLPPGVNGPNGLAIDPRDPSRMYLAAWAQNIEPRGLGGGIFGTTDGGAHWNLLFGGDQHVYDVTWNPANPSELYATGFESSAWHSTDRGENWKRIAGFNFKAGHRVTPDPAHPGMVYINTFGGGVWYGKVEGAPGVEDIATKEIAP